jgi:hypothetical protein
MCNKFKKKESVFYHFKFIIFEINNLGCMFSIIMEEAKKLNFQKEEFNCKTKNVFYNNIVFF